MSKDVLIDKGIKALIKALKEPPHVNVGILAGSSMVRKKGSTNAEVGAAHEFGSPSRGLPVRSFLRMPINDHLAEEIKKDPKVMRKTFEDAVRNGTLINWLKVLGVAATNVVKTAFTNGGYGTWEKLDEKTLARKTVKDILVETTQLRESITSEVVK